MITSVAGKWQRRIAQTLIEARMPLTYRQIAVRCGMVRNPGGTSSLLRNVMHALIARGIVRRCEPGLFVIQERE